MARKSQAIGAAGDEQGAAALARFGVLLLEKVATPIRRIPHPNPQIAAQGYCKIIYGEPVSGDWRGVWMDGTSVLAEIKTAFDRNLRWSDFDDHQPGDLSAHAALAMSLLVWVSSAGIFILRWPVPGFGPGQGLTVERARELDRQ